MTRCGCGEVIASIFDRRVAESDRERYRRRGPDRTTAMLLEMITARSIAGSTILDIGGGIGVIEHELIRAGAARAVLVDASRAYVEVARQEAIQAGLSDRITVIQGDFVDHAEDVNTADVVTLDRVVCCYPDMDSLVTRSANHALRLYGLVLPRDGWHTRLEMRVLNLWYRLRRSPYRAFAHPNRSIDRVLAARGLLPTDDRRTLAWRVVLYERAAPVRA